MKLIDTLERIERVDQLIRMKATGRPKELAGRIGISESNLYLLINTMKAMGACIYYCSRRRSYCYEQEMQFIYGFRANGTKQILGGQHSLTFYSKKSGVDVPIFESEIDF